MALICRDIMQDLPDRAPCNLSKLIAHKAIQTMSVEHLPSPHIIYIPRTIDTTSNSGQFDCPFSGKFSLAGKPL
jgi:hypothetical protein